MSNYKLENERNFRRTLLNGERITQAARLRHLSYMKTEAKSTFANKWDIGFVDISTMPRPKGEIYKEDELFESQESPVVFEKRIR